MNSDKQKDDLKDFDWPMWKIRWFNWISIISLLFALTIFLMPQMNDENKSNYRVILVLSLLVGPVLMQTFLWIAKVFLVIYKRIIIFPCLYSSYQNTQCRLLEVEQHFAHYALNNTTHMLEIVMISYHDKQLYLSLKKNSTLNLNKNDMITVIDKNDFYCMGQFKVTEIRTDVYYAVGTKLIDPVWLSFVMRKEEVEMTPNLVACCEKIGE